MSMNASPNSERFHIGIFGCINAGKSSLINAITSQDIALVSDQRGTTSDPVNKAMEILPLGPVLLTDTPGLDEEGELAEMRQKKTLEVLGSSHLALLVADAKKGLSQKDEELIAAFEREECPYLTVFNKADLMDEVPENSEKCYYVSARYKTGIEELKAAIAAFDTKEEEPFPIVRDMVREGDTVILVVPIDSSAPKGRLILPQQQTIRELIEAGACAVTVRDTNLRDLLAQYEKAGIRPALVITDSQVFGAVDRVLPDDIPLTSFSVLMARHKGILGASMEGIGAVKKLKDSDRVIVSEGCTHHRMCNDIGTRQIPRAIEKLCMHTPEYIYTSGTGFADEDVLKGAACVVHCGGCMLNEKEMKRRYRLCKKAGIPITNYGLVLAGASGILERCTEHIRYE